ncbi:MAG: hypothetical protein H6P96_1046 [Candidatus Aminicenantes bacterium]|nr:hypothetical protein [Candidatus Aminicenantes bacterium]
MKKVMVTVLAVGLVAALGTGQAFAQGKKVEFSLNLGVMTDLGPDSSFSEALFTVAPQVDIHLSPALMLSPEIMVITDDGFSFDPLLLYPGVLLNYTARGGFFAGAGVVLPVVFWEGESDTGDLLPKINLGYRGNHFNLTAYLLTDTESLFKYNLIGLSAGYRF